MKSIKYKILKCCILFIFIIFINTNLIVSNDINKEVSFIIVNNFKLI